MPYLDNAPRDSLTQCHTKDCLSPLLERMAAEYAAYRKPFSLMVIDIDGFKSFNDKNGHMFGDEALKYFASSLRLNLEDEDCFIIRFGGDEFVVVFPGRSAKELYRQAVHIGRNMRNRPFLFRGKEYKMSFSGGIASCPHDGGECQDILDKADKAMYFSKRHGSGRITQYSAMRLETIKHIVTTITVIAVGVIIASAVYRGFHINADAMRAKVAPDYSKIYLRSGNSIEGVITGEDGSSMSLKFKMGSGEGSVVIKKSDIKYVDRDYKK